jgi:hypothetical protein
MMELWHEAYHFWEQDPSLAISILLNLVLLLWLFSQRMHILVLRMRIHRLRNGNPLPVRAWTKQAGALLGDKVRNAGNGLQGIFHSK